MFDPKFLSTVLTLSIVSGTASVAHAAPSSSDGDLVAKPSKTAGRLSSMGWSTALVGQGLAVLTGLVLTAGVAPATESAEVALTYRF